MDNEVIRIDVLEQEADMIARYSFELRGLKILIGQFMGNGEFQISDEKYEEIFKQYLSAFYTFSKFSSIIANKYGYHEFNKKYFKIDTAEYCIEFSNNDELIKF